MASNLRVDTILPSTGTNVAIGTASGSVTFLGDTDITTSGSVSIGGTLTYEDVTNVDSVGVITARSGINVSSGDINLSSGKIGISSIIPASKLTVKGGSIFVGDNNMHGGSAGVIEYGGNTGHFDLKSYSMGGNSTIRMFTSASGTNTERFRINSSGSVSIGNNPTVHADTIFHIEDSGETNIKIEGSTSTLGARISLQNNDTTANAYSQYAFNDAGGQSTSAIQGINTDQTNNYGELAFLTRNAQGLPPQERMRISKEGYVTKPNQPSFTARSTGTWTHGSSTGYLDIDINMVEEFDVGGNYNGQIFTAPVTGKYFFSYTFQYQCTSGYLVVSLRKGVGGSYSGYGNMHMYPPQQSTKYHGPGIIGIMHLAAGNTVKPVAEVNYTGNQLQNVNFSGYLLG